MRHIFIVLLSTSLSAQLPKFVEVMELTADNQKELIERLNHWSDIETELRGHQSFVLEVMSSNKVYYCRGFEKMDELTDNVLTRWGDEGWNQEVLDKWKIRYPEDDESIKANFVMKHVFTYSPEMSYIPESIDLESTLPKMRFRRNVFLDIKSGNEWIDAYNQFKSVQENDKKLDNNYLSLVYMPIFGGFDNADFLMVVLDESREGYFKNLAIRDSKRENDADWKGIMENDVLNWINEEQTMIHY